MQVTFTRSGERRYSVAIERAVGPRLAARQGPGYDPYVPHDLVHFAVEAEAALRRAVFGSLAAGESGIFWPADQTRIPRERRHRRKPLPGQREEMIRSEQLAALSLPLWQLRSGKRSAPPAWFAQLTPEQLGAPLLTRICDRLDRVAPRWHALPVDGGITLTWPFPEESRRPQPVRRPSVDHPRMQRRINRTGARRG